MDITRVLGDSSGAVIYISLYPSKAEKHKDFNHFTKNMSNNEYDANTAQKVRKTVLSPDNTKSGSAVEAAHRLAEYPHRKISRQITIINTKS